MNKIYYYIYSLIFKKIIIYWIVFQKYYKEKKHLLGNIKQSLKID